MDFATTAKAEAVPDYGKKLGDYSLAEMKVLLRKEEQRLNVVKRQLLLKTAEQEGRSIAADDQGNVRRVFTQKEKDNIKRVFDEVDIDKSGYLDIEELGKVIMRLGVPLGGVELLQAHKELDDNGDGRVSFDEFLAWWGSDISRGRYRGAALAQLRGRLNATEASVIGSSSNLHVLRESGRAIRERKVNISTSFDFGEYNAAKATEVEASLKPGGMRTFKAEVVKAVDTDNLTQWLCPPTSIAADLWLAYKATKEQSIGLTQVRFGIAPGKKQVVLDLVEVIRKEHHKMLARSIKEEGLPEEGTEAHIAFEAVDIKLDEEEEEAWWSYEVTKKFREQCVRLGRHMKVERSEDGIETAEPGSPTLKEGTEDHDLLGYLQLVCDIDEAYDFMPCLKFDVTDTELTVSVLLFVSNTFHDEIKAKLESVVEKDLEEYINEVIGGVNLSLGIGGDLAGHFQRVMDQDASWLDMLGWGVMARFEANYNPKVIEAALSSNTEISNIMIPSVSAGMLKAFKQKLKVRNPLSKLSEIVDYLVADARCTFATCAGYDESGEGYLWDKEGDEQLQEVGKWAHFFLRSLKEKLRLGNPFFSGSITQLVRKVRSVTSESPIDGEELDGWSHLQRLKSGLQELRGLNASSPYFSATLTTKGAIRLLDPVPSEAVLKRLSGKRGSGEDPSHKAECEKRQKLLGLPDFDDDDWLDEFDKRFSVLKSALVHIENLKGGRGMASKDGLLFVTLLLKSLKLREIPKMGSKPFLLLLGFNPDAEDGSDSDGSDQHLGPRSDSFREGFTAIMRKASSIRLQNKK
eukprot:TRINITY_DN32609_c0_g1_i1.p1 TRINITY_DN32609_c0_g1~~TRINITY_DN32609_c0_g1_i1.p1  ORF type:complete len:817 (+),score=344.36 TRINITY_DN32609_c0_g1_i1:43-2451(+)